MVEGDRLRIRGPRRADPIARQLLANKAKVLEALEAETILASNIEPDDLPGDWRVEWEERAAIMEYDGGLPRERAEAVALAAISQAMVQAGDFRVISGENREHAS
jgi:hypothetical protein